MRRAGERVEDLFAVVHALTPCLLRPEPLDDDIDGQAVQPRREGGIAAKGPKLLPDANEHVLRQFIGVAAARHPSYKTVHSRQVSPVELLEGADVSRSGTGHVGSRLRRLEGLEWGPQRQRLQVPYPAPAWMDWRARRLEAWSAQHVVGVDGGALPPVPGGGQPKNREVQVGRIFRGVARGPDKPDHLAFLDLVPLLQAVGISLQVGVIVGVPSAGVELVNRVAAGLADEQFCNRSV